jgi:hypothetical protein
MKYELLILSYNISLKFEYILKTNINFFPTLSFVFVILKSVHIQLTYICLTNVLNMSTKQFVLRMKVLPTMRVLANWKNLNLI